MFFCPNCNNSFDISKTAEIQTGGQDKYVNLIKDILDKKKELDTEEVKKLSMKDLTDANSYKKLTSEQKELVTNTLSDIIPSSKDTLIKKTDKQSQVVFICTNCGYSKKIEPKTKIFSRISTEVSKNYSTNEFKDMINSDILPRTRKYICPKKDCASHKDPSKREAVFMRRNNSFRVVYMCTSCESIF